MTKWMTVSRMIEVCKQLEAEGYGNSPIGVRAEYGIVDAYPSVEPAHGNSPGFVDFDGEA